MAVTTTGLAYAALAVSAVSAYQQYEAGQDAAAAQRQQAEARQRQEEAQARQAEIQNVRAVRAQIRQARAASSSIIAQGATGGTLSSTGVAGGVSSVGSQLAGNMSYMSDIADTQTAFRAASIDYGNAATRMGEAQGRASEWGAIGGLSSTIFNATGGYKTIFGGNTGPSVNAADTPAHKANWTSGNWGSNSYDGTDY